MLRAFALQSIVSETVLPIRGLPCATRKRPAGTPGGLFRDIRGLPRPALSWNFGTIGVIDQKPARRSRLRLVEERSIMKSRRVWSGTRTGWSLVLGIVLAASGLGRTSAGAPPADTHAAANAPVAAPEAIAADHAARGFHGQPVRRRARRRAADRHDHRPQRAALGRRELLVPDLAGRPSRQGPDLDFRRRRSRRPVRSPDGLLRSRDQLHRDRAGLRRRVGLRHPELALHPRPRRRRPARRRARRQARRLGYEGAA